MTKVFSDILSKILASWLLIDSTGIARNKYQNLIMIRDPTSYR